MTPEERVRYLKEYDHAEKHGEPKKGSFLDRLIAKGNKDTEEELRREAEAKRNAGAGAGPGVASAPGQGHGGQVGGDGVIR